ncbi:MAG: (d)CMP kinase [Ignavibacteriales bacterium]|nr:(d)CMP kinase [Ignavibacteriales bacterium]
MKKIIIAIDGPAGSGKSTTAKLVAQQLGFLYIDTGAMYRAVTYMAIQNNLLDDTYSLTDDDKKAKITLSYENDCTKVSLNNEDVTEAIRNPEINANVSFVSAIGPIREEMIRQQREMGSRNGVVMEGRDIGTVVFPDADLKVFMVAALQTRAQRRFEELTLHGKKAALLDVMENLETRDSIDSSREVNPLMKAADAIEIDTTHVTIDNQVSLIVNLAKKKMELPDA